VSIICVYALSIRDKITKYFMIYIDQQRKVNFGYFIDKSILLITFHNLNELKASHLRF